MALGALVVGAVLGGCGLQPSRVVDTWPVGDPLACVPEDRCPELVAAGLAGLAARDGELAVVATWLHHEAARVDPVTGDQILSTRSGSCCDVLLVRLADGSERAIGVGFPGISQEPVVFDWNTGEGP